MKSLQQFPIFAIFVINFWECWSYKECKKIKPVENWDREWYFNALQSGLYIVASSECQNCENGDMGWQWLKQRNEPTKVCSKLYGVTPEGSFTVTTNCEFANPDIPQANCALDFSKYETVLTMKGSVTLILTDNENYAVNNFCIFGKENVWYIMSPRPTIDHTLKKQIIAQLVKLGFKSRLAIEGVSPVYFKNVTVC